MELTVVFDGEEAVRYVEGTEYDAIILDIITSET